MKASLLSKDILNKAYHLKKSIQVSQILKINEDLILKCL